LDPNVGVRLVTRRLATEISLCIIRCCHQFRIAVRYCVNADVACTTESSDEYKNAKDVSTSSVTEGTVLYGGVDLVVSTLVIRVSKTLALLS
jgi:hypothetical protein